MGNQSITGETLENFIWLQRYIKGDEVALNYVYRHVYKPLFIYGKKIINDDFVVNTIVQESILNGWKFRERMKSMVHIYRLMRLNVRWLCLSCYKDPRYGFHRRLVFTDQPDYANSASYSQWEEREEETLVFDEERINEIYRIIPYLPPDRQTILKLHFKYGLSYKRIARKFALSGPAVTLEIQKGLDQLKKIIHSRKKTAPPLPPFSPGGTDYSDCMPAEMLQIFRYRYEHKMGFERIAEKMNLNLMYVQRQYIEAHKRLLQLKNQV